MIRKVESNIIKLYAYWFFHNLIFAYVIERLFWESRGITVQQVVYTEIIYATVIVLLEVPTGVLADKWSRKAMMILSGVFSFLELLILIFASSFWHFAAAIFLAAIGRALSSGTSNAIIYDSLKLCGREKDFEKASGKNNFFDNLSSTLAALIGSFVAFKRGYITTYWMSLISMGIAFLISLTLVEPRVKTSTEENKDFSYMKEAYVFLKNQPSIKFVLAFGIISAACLTYMDEFWQLYFKEINVSVAYFGIISAVCSLFSSFSGILAYRLKRRFSYKVIFMSILGVFSIATIASSFITSWYGIIPLLSVFIVSGMVEPLVMGYLHHRTESHYRATVESFQSLVERLVIIAVGLLFGFFSTRFSLFWGFRFLGLLTAVYLIYFTAASDRYIEERDKSCELQDIKEC